LPATAFTSHDQRSFYHAIEIKMTENQPLAAKRQKVTSFVTNVLRRGIITGEYLGGDQIPQETVGEQLRVSRIPVREALLKLESEGLVVIHTHKGALVVCLTEEDATDLFEARAMIEPAVVKRAVQAAVPDDMAQVRSAMIEYERAVESGGHPEQLSKLNWAFHLAMCEAARRPRMLTTLRSPYTGADRYLWLQIDSPEARRHAMKDHRMLFHACSTKNEATAERLTSQHVKDALQGVLLRLRERQGSARAFRDIRTPELREKKIPQTRTRAAAGLTIVMARTRSGKCPIRTPVIEKFRPREVHERPSMRILGPTRLRLGRAQLSQRSRAEPFE
jgi:DNA-binding GntR family transcriptional regulator